MTETNTQPAGPGGPANLRQLRDDEIATGTAAVKGACRELILGGARPSINKVADASGLSVSSINREPYKGMLRAGRAIFDLVAQGMTYEDALALVGDTIEKAVATDDVSADPVVLALLARVKRLEEEVVRRDNQLYYTLGIVGRLRANLRWHRANLRDLNLRIEGITLDPLPSRTPRVWQEDIENIAVGEMYDDDDDEDDDGQ